MPIPRQPGRAQRHDYAYERTGTWCIVLACEPLRGWRFVQVRKQRTALASAAFRPERVTTYAPAVDRMQLVHAPLHPHTLGAFDHALAPQDAFEWAQKCPRPSTPITGSWLNMAAIERSALARQCLDRRLGDLETLEKEAIIWS